MSTLRGDGCVLVPVDAAGRVLELLLLLEEFWAREKWVSCTRGWCVFLSSGLNKQLSTHNSLGFSDACYNGFLHFASNCPPMTSAQRGGPFHT